MLRITACIGGILVKKPVAISDEAASDRKLHIDF